MSDEVCIGSLDGKDVTFSYDLNEKTLIAKSLDPGVNDESSFMLCNEEVVTVMKDSAHDKWLIKTIRASAPDDKGGSDRQFEEYVADDLPQQFVVANEVSETHPYNWSVFTVPEPLVIIRSKLAGTGKAMDYYEKYVHKALQIGREWAKYEISDYTTDSEDSIRVLAKSLLERANNGDRQTLLLLSGDGGVHDLINILLLGPQSPQYCRPRLGLLPFGTGNAIANSCGLNSNATMGLRQFLRGRPYSLPTFTARFSPGSVILKDQGRTEQLLPTDGQGHGLIYGAVVCSWALHASLVANSDTPEYRQYGAEGFVKAASDLVDPPDGSASHIYRGRITLFTKDAQGLESGRVLARKEHMYVLATMQSHLADGFNISPSSKPLDGQLRVVHFGPMSSDQMWPIMNLAMDGTGRHVKQKDVGYESIQGMRIDFEEEDACWRRVCIDGQIVRVNKGGWVEVMRNNMDVIQLIADLL